MQPHKSHEILTEGGCLQTGGQVNVTMEPDSTSMSDMTTSKKYLQSSEAGMIIYYGRKNVSLSSPGHLVLTLNLWSAEQEAIYYWNIKCRCPTSLRR